MFFDKRRWNSVRLHNIQRIQRRRLYNFYLPRMLCRRTVDWTNIKYIPAELGHEKLHAGPIKPQRNDILMSEEWC